MLGLALSGVTGDWPQWRGPTRDGISRETGLLGEWPAEGPRQLWQIQDAGDGYSTPAVSEGRLYLLGNRGLDNEFVQARDADTGRLLWSAPLGKVGQPDQKPNYPGARSTPTVVGRWLYVLGSDGDLACLATDTGAVRWRHQLREEFGGQPGIWAYAESPLIDGDTVVCAPGGKTATLLALDRHTGKVVWQCAVPDGDEATYSSTIVTTLGGVKQYIQGLKKGLLGVAAATGDVLWQFGETADLKNGGYILTPVTRNDLVYSASGLIGGAAARVSQDAHGWSAESVYFSKKLPIGIGGVVLSGDYMYGASGTTLQCVEFATGKVRWEDRCIGAASICAAEGRLYLHGENGDVALVEITAEGYREKGRFTPTDQPDRGNKKAWTYPVVANGRLYLRDLNDLRCYDIAAR
ncbi:MAG: PQQ-like beta-propeller repeat protein [Verrucomicrobiales bacterium]|nr:PQQ-like beta-propeller repeat protein [Verrucomicrobiales bacterium]